MNIADLLNINKKEENTKKEKFDIRKLRCVHRHTIEEHPSCFAKGMVKYDFKDDREFERLTGVPWYQFPSYKIGYLDIETDGLKADFSTMLSWAIKEKGGDIVTGVIKQKELFNGVYDKRLIEDCINELKKYAIICTYNGTRFDIAYLRTKALHYGIEFPGYGELYHFDLYYTCKSKLNLSRKSLANVTDYLGIEGKTDISKDAWRKAKYGDPDSLAEVVKHNIPDVVILEKLHDKLDFVRKWIRTSI